MLAKFIYDLTGRPKPKADELEDELDRLLLMKSAEQPNYLVPWEERDLNLLDSEVISYWLRRRFEPALIIMLLFSDDNYTKAKCELAKMDRYENMIEKTFRSNFVARRAKQRIQELCFDDVDNIKAPQVYAKLRRALTFLSNHLGEIDTVTLQGTDLYAPSDVALYNYLKRIVVGNYKEFGLKSHVKLCEPLLRFMSRYATKNTHVINVSHEDPLANSDDETSLTQAFVKPTIFALGFMLLYLWRHG